MQARRQHVPRRCPELRLSGPSGGADEAARGKSAEASCWQPAVVN